MSACAEPGVRRIGRAGVGPECQFGYVGVAAADYCKYHIYNDNHDYNTNHTAHTDHADDQQRRWLE